jgi:hypothetical protein
MWPVTMAFLTMAFLHHVPLVVWPAITCVVVFGVLLCWFWHLDSKRGPVYFDAQDFVHYEQGGGRELPVSASTGTFAPLLGSYLDVMKLLITVAAASIAFGGGQHPERGVMIAKISLSFSILYGVVFASLLQFFYDDYCQDVRAYTPFRYALIEALGFSTLVCFIGGYFSWAFNLA